MSVDPMKKLQALWNDYVVVKNDNLNLQVELESTREALEEKEEELKQVREELSGLKENSDVSEKETKKKSSK